MVSIIFTVQIHVSSKLEIYILYNVHTIFKGDTLQTRESFLLVDTKEIALFGLQNS